MCANPVWSALVGPHRALGEGGGRARRYREEYVPFAALHDAADDRAWADLAALIGGGVVAVAGPDLRAPAGWTVQRTLEGLQLTAAEAFAAEPDPGVVVLGAPDLGDMLDLVRRTDPGPFRSRTGEMGRYLGVRVEGRLVALAGERMHLDGWTEISGVCTDPDFRGRGLAARLVRAVGSGIQARGEQAVLHVLEHNTSALRLYERLGFVVRRPMRFLALGAPQR